MELSSITIHIPNWKRFSERYNPEQEFISAFFTQIQSIEDSIIQEIILKRINIELGILLLHDAEMDRDLYGAILQSIQNK